MERDQLSLHLEDVVSREARRRARDAATRLLAQELGLATGCTEPAALAFAVCAAARAATGEVRSVDVRMDPASYKNTLSVGLPGTTERGPLVAAAVGAALAEHPPSLDVLGRAGPQHWEAAAALIDAGLVVVDPTPVKGLFVEAIVSSDHHTARARLRGRHDRLAELRVDDQPRWPGPGADDPGLLDDEAIAELLATPSDLVRLTEALEPRDLVSVREALETNLALVSEEAEALRGHPGRIAAIGIRRRMNGEARAVATSGGSGNSGLTIALGLWATVPEGDERLHRALALAHFANVAVKARIGRVGPLCGGVIASATAVGCGLAWHGGGGAAAVGDVIREMVDSLAGVVCDGANRTCAGKISMALETAIAAAHRACAGPGDYAGDGLGGSSARDALEHLAELAAATGPALDLALVKLLAPER